ncbi:HNH endonuclease family protein [Pseudomonas sp. JBR1]|uniref:HNH endonuclease family protein n=1 Tax=Pseudomonas sp. JBR1 TaxID=3020907 RepID=UPI0023056B4A|nr:HNH endonuclease family protein [Pseudomonas sp. JBR1]WCE06711.1 HNH endonuclease family protein [Pseudomonas sp. JBR1]
MTFRIFELGGADTRHKVGEYVRLGHDIYRTSIPPQEIQERLDEISKKFSINDVLKSIDWNDRYTNWGEQLRYLLYRYDEYLAKEAGEKINQSAWNKIWHSEPSSSIEHIQPQSSGAKYAHQLGNLTMLPPGINSSLNKRPPKEKFDTYISCGLRATVQAGLDIKERNSWTEAMIKRRTKQIEDFIRSEWAD